MTRQRSRREMLTGWVGVFRQVSKATGEAPLPSPEDAIRPPGALSPDEKFLAACTGCKACVEACPPKALVFLGEESGIPALVPARQACVLCTELPCIEACPEGALLSPGGPTFVRMGVAQVDPRRCVTFKGEPCRECFDACPYPQQALLLIGMRPVVSRSACTGCGLCERACPEWPRAVTIVAEQLLVPGLRVPREEVENR